MKANDTIKTLEQSGLVWTFSQPWRSGEEEGFNPGEVFLGRQDTDLLILANLEEKNAMKDEFPFNYPAFTRCDTFEIFIGPRDETVYYELHATPSNSIMQLRFDSNQPRLALELHAVQNALFTSRTCITSDGWSVFAQIPIEHLFPRSDLVLCLSFGRYDYRQESPNPVISTTSPHTVCNFHRKQEWRQLAWADVPRIDPEQALSTARPIL